MRVGDEQEAQVRGAVERSGWNEPGESDDFIPLHGGENDVPCTQGSQEVPPRAALSDAVAP